MRLFLLLTILLTFSGVISIWIWHRYQGHPVSIEELVSRYWQRFILGAMALSLIVVGLEGGYLL